MKFLLILAILLQVCMSVTISEPENLEVLSEKSNYVEMKSTSSLFGRFKLNLDQNLKKLTIIIQDWPDNLEGFNVNDEDWKFSENFTYKIENGRLRIDFNESGIKKLGTESKIELIAYYL